MHKNIGADWLGLVRPGMAKHGMARFLRKELKVDKNKFVIMN